MRWRDDGAGLCPGLLLDWGPESRPRSNVVLRVRLVGQLSNPSAALTAVFEGLSDEPIKAVARPEPQLDVGRLGNGVVQRAVVKALALAQRPLTVLETQAAVVDLFGHSVSKGSINCCLSTGALGDEPRFERVARGCYRLRRDWLPVRS